MGYGFASKCLYGDAGDDEGGCDCSGAVVFPIYQSATFTHPELGRSTGYDYSRAQNPTREHLENIVSTLENGAGAVAMASGMAAIAAVMELFHMGDHIITDIDLYGGSIRLFDEIGVKNGLTFTHIDCSQDDVDSCITEQTKAIYIESPTNPMMHIVDIRKMAETAHQHKLLLIVDNTFLSPYFQKPIELGADLVIHSATKYLAGHNDTLAGIVVASTKELSEKLHMIEMTTGGVLSPFDSFLVTRGIQTLPVRMERAQENAKILVSWLENCKSVTRVFYPGIKESRGYEISEKQTSGFGAMISFEVDRKESVPELLERVRLIHFAESLGGVETLITYPIRQTHASVPQKILEKTGLTDRILRLSVGIEDIQDLLNEFERIFA